MYNRSLDLMAIALAKAQAGDTVQAAKYLAEAASHKGATAAVHTVLSANKKKKKKSKASFNWPFKATANDQMDDEESYEDEDTLVDLELEEELLAAADECAEMSDDEEFMELSSEEVTELDEDDDEEVMSKARASKARAARVRSARVRAELMEEDLESEMVGEEERVVPEVAKSKAQLAARLQRALANVTAASKRK